MTKNVVDLVDFGILYERRLENLNICMSQNMVDLVDLGFPLIKVPKSKYVYVPKRG